MLPKMPLIQPDTKKHYLKKVKAGGHFSSDMTQQNNDHPGVRYQSLKNEESKTASTSDNSNP